MKRIAFLDGFRGLAILLVVLYHSYARWASKMQFEQDFSFIPFIGKGWVGIHLFFLVSGFVILLTLEKSKNLGQFLVKRWYRLFPAMLIATVILFITATLLPERPEGIPKISATIPGLFFIEPRWIYLITGAHTGILDGAFWSLFVEVKYYFIFGSLYFLIGKEKAIITLFLFYITWLCVTLLLKFTGSNSIINVLETITTELSFKHFGWFATGSMAYIYFTSKDHKYIVYALVTGIVSAASIFLPYSIIAVPGIIILLLFLSAVYFDGVKKIVANKWLLFLGFISYPLYLVHQNAIVAMTIKINHRYTYIPDVLLPVIPILVMASLAFLIAKYAEPYTREVLKFRFTTFRFIQANKT